MNRTYFTYIASNFTNSVLYTGVTNNLDRRMYEHRNKLIEGFSSRYNVNKLLFYQEFSSINEAISAEKKIKGWVRVKKIKLIKTINPNFKDLLSY